LQIDPNNARAHNNLGIALSDQGKLDEAIACYQKALQIDPNYADAHINLGIALSDQGKVDEAIGCYQKALQIDPNEADAHNNLGIALYEQGKLDEAIAELEIAVRLDPSSTLFRNNLEIYKKKKNGYLSVALAKRLVFALVSPWNSACLKDMNLGYSLHSVSLVDILDFA
jgi:tetratricopeptide (TPR) repeat protein